MSRHEWGSHICVGLMTGVVVDSGDGVTHIVPVFDGYALPHLTRRLDVAGRDVTRYLIKLLLLRGYAFNRTADFETVRQIKEKLCYIGYVVGGRRHSVKLISFRYDLELEKHLASETTVLVENYTLPDGRIIKVGSERFEAPEAMFQPHLVDVESVGVAGEFVLLAGSRALFTDPSRTPVQHHPSCGHRFAIGIIQTHCAFGWFQHVPWLAESSGEGGEAAVPAENAQGGYVATGGTIARRWVMLFTRG